MSDSGKSDWLRRQLERARFERALQIAEGMADRRVLLTTAELARLNNIMTGQKESSATPIGVEEGEGPWRTEAATIVLPSGRQETFSLIANPMKLTRDKLHRATELAEAGAILNAVVDIYSGLVLSHVFKDANRRTAAVAAHYYLRRYGVPLSGLALHEMGLGDLRQEGQIEALRDTVGQMAKFVTKR